MKKKHKGDEVILSYYIGKGLLFKAEEQAECIGRELTDIELQTIVNACVDTDIPKRNKTFLNNAINAVKLIKQGDMKIICLETIIKALLENNRESDAYVMAEVLNEM